MFCTFLQSSNPGSIPLFIFPYSYLFFIFDGISSYNYYYNVLRCLMSFFLIAFKLKGCVLYFGSSPFPSILLIIVCLLTSGWSGHCTNPCYSSRKLFNFGEYLWLINLNWITQITFSTQCKVKFRKRNTRIVVFYIQENIWIWHMAENYWKLNYCKQCCESVYASLI